MTSDYFKAWYDRNRDRINAKHRAAHAVNPEKRRERDRNKSFEAKAKRAAYFKSYYEAHKEEIKALSRKREISNPERRRQEVREWCRANPDKRKEITRTYREDNPEKVKVARKSWYVANYKRWAAYAGVRRSRLLQRTPAWADLSIIVKFYEACPEGYHVDHIYPLCGRYVSGLHVLENLQYLSVTENLKKSNKMPENV